MVRLVATTLLTLALALMMAPSIAAQQRSCPSCYGQGKTRCVMCQGTGKGKCYGCQGRGNLGYVQGRLLRCNVCSGMGFRIRGCLGCNGQGGRTCGTCYGRGRVGQPQWRRTTPRHGQRRQPVRARQAIPTITVGPYRFQGVFTESARLQNRAGIVALAHWDKTTWRIITLRSTGNVGASDFFKRDPVIANALKMHRNTNPKVQFGVAVLYTAKAEQQAKVQKDVRAKLTVGDAQYRSKPEITKPPAKRPARRSTGEATDKQPQKSDGARRRRRGGRGRRRS